MVVGFSLASVDKKQYSEVHSLPYLINRFHFAVRLYSDNARMTSKRGGNKEVRYEPQASCVTDVLTGVLCALSANRPTAKWNLLVLFNNKHISTHFVTGVPSSRLEKAKN